MKKIIGIMILCLLITTALFAQDNDGQEESQFFTVKGYVGYNLWYIPSIMGLELFSNEDIKIAFGGFAFGAQALFLDRTGLQVGLGFAVLPMMSVKEGENKAGLTLMPLTADLVFNYKKIQYTCLGFGIGFVNLSGKGTNDVGEMTSANLEAGSGMVFKFGQGMNYPITKAIAIDLGVDMYFPLAMGFGGDYELELSPFMTAIMFSQFNFRIGASFSL